MITRGMFKLFLAITLSVVVSLESITVKWVKSNQEIDPPSEHLVILEEITKGIVCGIIYLLTKVNSSVIVTDDRRHLLSTGTTNTLITNSNSLLYFMVPAFLYTVSNNITFAALSYLSSSMFSLLMNLKIPMTGFLAYLILKKPISHRGWMALTMMFFGSVFACVRLTETSVVLNCSFIGMCLMVMYSICSASAAVCMEYLTRYRFKDENIFLQNVKFCVYGIIFNLIMTIIRGNIVSWSMQPIHILSVVSMSLNGLTTAAVIKYAGSITKTYSVAFAALLTSLLAFMIWHQVLTWNYYIGTALCSVAIQLYVYDKARG